MPKVTRPTLPTARSRCGWRAPSSGDWHRRPGRKCRPPSAEPAAGFAVHALGGPARVALSRALAGFAVCGRVGLVHRALEPSRARRDGAQRPAPRPRAPCARSLAQARARGGAGVEAGIRSRLRRSGLLLQVLQTPHGTVAARIPCPGAAGLIGSDAGIWRRPGRRRRGVRSGTGIPYRIRVRCSSAVRFSRQPRQDEKVGRDMLNALRKNTLDTPARRAAIQNASDSDDALARPSNVCRAPLGRCRRCP